MPYTTEEGGRLNNFAIEPKMYEAEVPTKSQQINYLFLGIAGLALIGGLIFVAYSVSNLG
ncbi:MAG TPA: ssl1498 family light-harvesting-like protein [Cyanobacteria bacterium UBA11149]|nr:ssl1498 family light-harvesting-like protein [Cyanobacteria bacterium UBA11367]HBK65941.1 ssl1498 family light-harvesting-like protein [Cyanobacteria bacterium UBA11166]HBR72593.1 ssl1498 family light-harvesting-like protein [Cyanobacteria bacterium UBA11159]HBW91316.1 ssl1498 family light-harvesting-like protein [Cyanobacteria bacterium UBA11149]HCA95223.1 ssl1498 family light-harvesting-like protein [Cyanobacteria bacterium UBA9226]